MLEGIKAVNALNDLLEQRRSLDDKIRKVNDALTGVARGNRLDALSTVIHFIKSGKKVEACKMMRDITGWSLKDSISFVELFTP